MVASPTATGVPDASRARRPDASGFVVRDGVRIAWDRYGEPEPAPGRRTLLLAPTWSIVHSRFWKAQVPYLARHHRVVTWDGRGNGRSDRPTDAAAYGHDAFAADGLAVLDATSTPSVVVVSASWGASWSLLLTAAAPERVRGLVFIAPALPVTHPRGEPVPSPAPFDVRRDRYEGWDVFNRHAWRADYRGFVEFFFGRCFTEAHSTKPIEDCVDWALDTDAETLIRTRDAWRPNDREAAAELIAQVRCPSLVIHGTEDDVRDAGEGAELARMLGAELLLLEGSGHLPMARDPVAVNLAIRRFVDRLPR